MQSRLPKAPRNGNLDDLPASGRMMARQAALETHVEEDDYS